MRNIAESMFEHRKNYSFNDEIVPTITVGEEMYAETNKARSGFFNINPTVTTFFYNQLTNVPLVNVKYAIKHFMEAYGFIIIECDKGEW